MIAPAGSPFVHVFAHSGGWYAYDVNTNDLLEVDAALGRTLAALTSEQPSRALERLAAEIGQEAISAALAEIEEAQRDEGLFSCHRPRIVPRQLTDTDRASYESKLSHLILTVTEDCNLSCRYCPQAAQRGSPGGSRPQHMPLGIALKALDYFVEHCRDTDSPAVSFYGGEPLLRFDLISGVVSYARSRRDWPELRFIIDTNGTLIDDAVAEFVAREKLYLQISLDGPGPVHDRWRVFRDGRGSHAAVLVGLQHLLQRDPSAVERISVQVTAAPPVDLEALAIWSREFAPYRELGLFQPPLLRVAFADLSWDSTAPPMDAKSLAPQLASAQNRWLRACEGDCREHLDPVTRRLFDADPIRIHHRSRQRLAETLVPGGCCLLGVRRLHVAPDGTLEPCERATTHLSIGHVAEGIDQERVAGLAQAFSHALGDRCHGCWAARLCGLCYAGLSRDDGKGDLVMREDSCKWARERAVTMLRGYVVLMASSDSAREFLQDSRVS